MVDMAVDEGIDGRVEAGVVAGLEGESRTQTIHHPRLVLQVRSSSWGRERVSVYVVKRRWWMARDSTRDKGGGNPEGEGDGDERRDGGDLGVWDGVVEVLRFGMLGMEDRMVRFDGS